MKKLLAIIFAIGIVASADATVDVAGCNVRGGWPGAQYGQMQLMLQDAVPCYGYTGVTGGIFVLQDTPSISTPNFMNNGGAGTGYFTVDGNVFGQHVTNYHVIQTPDGTLAFQAGNAADPTNYYKNTSHNFSNKDGSVLYSKIISTGIKVYSAGQVAGVGSVLLTMPSTASDFSWNFPAANVNLATTGGTANYLKQTTVGGPITSSAVSAGEVAGGQALTTGAADANVIITLGGTPSLALLQGASITLSWSGQLSVARGGTGLGTLTAHAIQIGNGTGSLTQLALGTANQVLHGNAAADPTWSAVASADMNITTTSCTNQFVTAISAGGVGTCTTDTLASAQHANQGTTTTLLHGNAAGNPSFAAVSLTADVAGILPVANGGAGSSLGPGKPFLYATLTSNQNVTSATVTKVTLTAITDSGSYYSSGVYTPLVAGTYQVCYTMTAQATLWASLSNNTQALVSKNGLAGGAGTTLVTGYGDNVSTTAPTSTISGCAIVAMNGSTDTLELDAYVGATTAPAVTGGTGLSQGLTSLTIMRIGP